MQIEGSSMQQMLLSLLKQPDPQAMLEHSRPFDRSQESLQVKSETGQVIKHYWQGALPAQIRDESLNLAYDIQLIKNKRSKPSSARRSHLNNNNNSSRRQNEDARSISSDSMRPLSASLNSTGRAANFNATNNNSRQENMSPNVFSSSSIEEIFSMKQLYQPPPPTVSQAKPSRIFSGNRKPTQINNFNNDSLEFIDGIISPNSQRTERPYQQQAEKKSFSIKYIGVHNDIIGILSRKIPLEFTQNQKYYPFLSKSKENNLKNKNQTMPSSPFTTTRGRTSINFFNKTSKVEDNDVEFESDKLKPSYLMQKQPRESNASSAGKTIIGNKVLSKIESNSNNNNNNPEESLQMISEEEYMHHQSLHVNPYEIDQAPLTSRLQTPSKKYHSTQQSNISSNPRQKFYGEPISKLDQNATTTTTSSFYQPIISDIVPPIPPPSSAPTSLGLGATSHSFHNRTHSIKTNQKLSGKLQQNQQKHFQIDQQMDYSDEINVNYEVPQPEKYDKFLVHKYSMQRKLVAMKRPKEDSPNYQKKQFFNFLNNN